MTQGRTVASIVEYVECDYATRAVKEALRFATGRK